MIILYYFDKKEGTKVFYSYPKRLLDIDITDKIGRIMDISIEDGYIILVLKNKYVYNFYFEIDSELARGKKELLLLSLLFNKRLSIKKEEEMVIRCNNLIHNFKSEKNIYMGFYIKIMGFNTKTKEDDMLFEKRLKNTILIRSAIRRLFKEVQK